MSIYFIGDLHFNHKNILKYEPSRVAAIAKHFNIDESNIDVDDPQMLDYHNRMLIDNWNSVVKSHDVVWLLGDVGLGSKDSLATLVSQLKGVKKMIMGNHDHFKRKDYEAMGFKYVSQYPIIIKNKDNQSIVLSHAPVEEIINDENSLLFNIYAHVHSNSLYQTITSHSQCVSVERQNFTPIRINGIE